MPDSIRSLKGITDDLAAKLGQKNITDTDALLAATAEPSARRKLAGDLGIEPSLLTEFINRADLSRINGIGGVYADLLEFAGVDSVKELAHRVPANLYSRLEQVNEEKKLTTRLPRPNDVEGWVGQAQEMTKLQV